MVSASLCMLICTVRTDSDDNVDMRATGERSDDVNANRCVTSVCKRLRASAPHQALAMKSRIGAESSPFKSCQPLEEPIKATESKQPPNKRSRNRVKQEQRQAK